MAGVKPKFKIEWTKKDNKTASVPGSTYEEMFKYFEKKNASNEEWAKFHHERPDLSFKPAKGEPITEVTLKVGYVITMPSWSKASSLNKKGKAAWDKMMAALEKHEDNHRQILEKQSDLFGEKITAETDLTLKKLAELFKKFPADVTAAQDKYDSATSHGEKEGVFLPAPDKVND
jgi:hypothetical protein